VSLSFASETAIAMRFGMVKRRWRRPAITRLAGSQSLVCILRKRYIARRARNLLLRDGPSLHELGLSGREMRGNHADTTQLSNRRHRHRSSGAQPPQLRESFPTGHASELRYPPHACDCHTHIYGDPKEFPLPSLRPYTPEATPPEEMSALHRALHMERVVIVTPSAYGADNSATLYGMKARGANARGVAVIDDKTPESDLDAMNRAGVRGIRIISGRPGPSIQPPLAGDSRRLPSA